MAAAGGHMIRFSPDGFAEAILRPVIMALPQGWVYTEIMAPDLRFLAIVVFVVAGFLTCFARRRMWSPGRSVIVPLACLSLAFGLWLSTGGNGRYFMTFMVFAGPVLATVIYRSTYTKAMRITMLGLTCSLQMGAVAVNSPWRPFDSLEWSRWRGHDYFDLDEGDARGHRGVTYVTFTGQSQAFLAPKFHPDSSWLNLSWFDGHDFLASQDHVVAGMRARLSGARRLRIFLQAQPRQAHPVTGAPDNQAVHAINGYLEPFGLVIREPGRCSLLKSKTLGETVMISTSDTPAEIARLRGSAGYWLCDASYEVRLTGSAVSVTSTEEARARRAIERLESLCPRLFPSGQYALKKNGYGYTRGYSASDSSATFVLSESMLYVKFLRALNPQPVAPERELLRKDFKIDCGRFVSREGLPWLRQL